MNSQESQGTPASEQRKLHPSAIVIWLVDNTRSLLTALLPFLFGRTFPFVWLLFIPFGLSVVGPFFKYLRFRYEVTPQTLVVEGGGIFNKWRRVIPTERIQSIDVIQKLRHRVFGVVELRIEVIGGSATEAQMVALKPTEADRVRSIATHGSASGPSLGDSDALPPALARLAVKDLVLAGVTGGRVAFLGLLFANLTQIFPEEQVFKRAFDSVAAGRAAWFGVVVVGAMVLLAALAGSLTLTVLTYWDFTVSRQNGNLLVTRGLLSTRRSTIPLSRIQAINLKQNLVRRPFGLASLSVVVAGYSSGRSQGNQSAEAEVSATLLPIARLRDAYRVAEQVLDVSAPFDSMTLNRAPGRALQRSMVNVVVLSLIVTAVGFAIQPSAWWGGPTVLVLGGTAAYLSWKTRRHGFTSMHVLRQSGVLGRKTTIVPLANLQHTGLNIGPIQRAMRLTTVRLTVPKLKLRLHNLDQATADGIFMLLSR